MFKNTRRFPTAFIGFLMLLQLVLLPATHLLHFGCQHSHDAPEAGFRTVFGAIESAWKNCDWFSCCDHCSPDLDDQPRDLGLGASDPRDPDPLQAPHDERSCAVCQAIFAARIATTSPCELLAVEPVCEVAAIDSHSADSHAFYCVLSRGPPTAV